MELILIMIAVAANFLLLKWKVEHERYADAAFDVIVLVILSYLFSGSYGGMVVAMGAGAIISVYLLKYPPKFLHDND